MNLGVILLFLLLGNGNGRTGDNTGCGCDRPNQIPPLRPREREGGFERDRERDFGREREMERDSCPCNNNDSRFEPRFEPGPFPEPGCGCSDN